MALHAALSRCASNFETQTSTQTIAQTAAQEVMGCILGTALRPQRRSPGRASRAGLDALETTATTSQVDLPNAADATARTTVLLMVLVQGGGRGSGRGSDQEAARDYHEARGSGAGPSRACCRKPLMNSRSSTAMPSSDAASSGAPDDASSAESESDTDTVDTAARAGGRGAGAVARGARGRRAGSSIVANDSTAGSRE